MAELLDNCRFTAGSSGTSDFADGTATPSFRNLEDAGAVNGVMYPYKAQNATGTEWEIGRGTAVDTAGTWYLDRTDIQDSSNSGAAVNFTTNPTVILTAGRGDIANTSLAINKVVTQVFTASGTYTPSAGMVYAVFECVGSSGGSGGTANSGSLEIATAGGSGGGEYRSMVATAAMIGASQAVTIGAPGVAGAAGNNNGTDGGDTSVGALCVAKGGKRGLGNNGSSAPAGGDGGDGGTGTLGIPGQDGQGGASSSALYPSGGGGDPGGGFGHGARSIIGTAGFPAAGRQGKGYGAGASGGQTYNAAGAAAGANGLPGVAIITEFCAEW